MCGFEESTFEMVEPSPDSSQVNDPAGCDPSVPETSGETEQEKKKKLRLDGALYFDSLHPISRGERIVRLAQHASLGYPERLAEEFENEIPGLALTFQEALVIVRYWTREVLKNYYNCFLMGGFDTDWRLARQVVERLEAMAKLAGRDVIKYGIDIAILEFGKRENPRYWHAFWNGTPEERDQVMDEVRHELEQQMDEEEKAKQATS